MLTIGTKFGRYEIRAKIGAGGMGEVYLVEDTKLDRKVALKILPADVAADINRMNLRAGSQSSFCMNCPRQVINVFAASTRRILF